MDLRAVLGLVERVRRRVRLRRALDLAVKVAVPAAGVSLALLLAYKLGFLPRWWAARLLVAVAAAPLLAAIVAALRRIPPQAAAKRADDACGLSDRLGSALAFARESAPDPFVEAQLRDAARYAVKADARMAAPIALPGTESRALAVLLAAIAVVALLQFRACMAPAGGIHPTAKLGGGKIDGTQELVQEITADARRLDDPELEKLAQEIQALLKKYEQGEITRKELFEKLAELEHKYEALREGDFEALKEKLRKAGEALAKEQPTREAGKALEKDDLDKAKQQLEELAKKIAENKADSKPTEKALAEAAEKLRRQLEDEQKKMDAQKRSLEEQKRELDKLSREEKSEQEKRRLEDQKRELERLQRQQQDQRAQRDQQRRQLERLSRSMSEAAQQMQSGNQQGASQQMQQSAQQMGRMADEMRRAGEAQRVRVQMMDLKEMVRRAGQTGEGKDGKGKQGKMGEFLARAGGKPGEGKGQDGKDQLFMEGEGQPGEPKLMLPGMGRNVGPRQQTEGEGQGQGPQPFQGQHPGNGIGNEHDPNLQGDPSKLASKKRDVSVEGQQGPGPTRSEVIYGAADKGFSQRSYKRVYTDYSNVVEEAMSREQVPLGMRYYVKRYFNLIKPRE